MAISEKDIKLLWGRAAGICSHPQCKEDLTKRLKDGNDFVIGEMAHVIARREGGPRGREGGGNNTYDNLILLCPTHHTEIDKAPEGTFPVEELQKWKQTHEENCRSIGCNEIFDTFEELATSVSRILAENRKIWESIGPNSETALRNPGSNSYRLWELRRLDRVLPNNQRIVNIIRANEKLLDRRSSDAFAEFLNHADSYRENVYDRLDEYPLFPQKFAEIFS